MVTQSTQLYTLFWIPVRKKPFKNECVKDSAELIVKDPGFFVCDQDLLIRIEKKNKDTFSVDLSPYNIEGAGAIHVIDLHSRKHDQCGFIEFEIDYIQNITLNYPFKDIWNALSIQIYRILKNIFHIHKYHRQDDYFIDAAIPFSNNLIIDNKNESERYHNFYFEYITDKIEGYRNFLIDKIEDHFTLKNQSSFLRFRKLLTIRRYVDDIIGILDYLAILSDLDHELLEKIKWYSRDILRIKREVSETYNAKRATASVFLGILGLLLGALSIGQSWFWSNKSSTLQEITEQKHENISAKHDSLINAKYEQMEKHLQLTDSLINELFKNNQSLKIDTVIQTKKGIQIELKNSK